jgi:hypothetical protein
MIVGLTDLTRRELLGRGAAAAGALALSEVPTMLLPGRSTGRSGSPGSATTFRPFALQSRAGKELGLRMLYEFAGLYAENRLVRHEPAAFDILAGYSHLVSPEWPSGHLRPVEIAKISQWGTVLRPRVRASRASARRCVSGAGHRRGKRRPCRHDQLAPRSGNRAARSPDGAQRRATHVGLTVN